MIKGAFHLFNMGHRNIPFTNHMIDVETDRQNGPEPCIFYNYPHPNMPPPRNHCNFNFHHMPERPDSLFYGPPPHLSTMYSQYPTTNLDYNPYPVHGAHTDRYGRRTLPPHMDMDGVGGSFKRKNMEGSNSNFPHNNAASAGPSSSSIAAPMNADSDVALMCGVESGSHRSVRNGPGVMGPGNYVAQMPGGSPWLDVHFGGNNGDVGTYAWTHAPLPYVHGSVNGACVEGGSMGYQLTGANRSCNGFLHPSPHHPPPHMQGLRGFNNVNLPSSSQQISTVNSLIHPFPDIGEAAPTFMSPVPPTGFRLYRPHRRDIVLDSSARNYSLPHLRVLPEDEVAILEIPGYHEAGESNDQHRDMRLDIDHMSYEELLALGEHIGCVGTGLSEEFVSKNLKIRTFTSSAARLNLQDATRVDQPVNFCVVCQTDYEDGENIGTLDCGHEYHKECVKKWLLVKNTCPVCKSTALGRKAKDPQN